MPRIRRLTKLGRAANRKTPRENQSVGDPADQVAFGNVADKEKKAVSGLIEATVTQSMTRHRAGIAC
jgi:hypothetical protein